MRRGTVKLRRSDESRNAAQSVTLLEAIAEFGFDAAIGGARRDEEKARAKERVFSSATSSAVGSEEPAPGAVEPLQHPVAKGEHMRVFPHQQLDGARCVQYIERGASPCPRSTMRTAGPSCAGTVCSCPYRHHSPREARNWKSCRCAFRTVGDISCTCPVESDAATAAEIIAETALTTITSAGDAHGRSNFGSLHGADAKRRVLLR